MPFQFTCPQGHWLQGDESQVGMQTQCPLCGLVFVIPQPAPQGVPQYPQPQQPYPQQPQQHYGQQPTPQQQYPQQQYPQQAYPQQQYPQYQNPQPQYPQQPHPQQYPQQPIGGYQAPAEPEQFAPPDYQSPTPQYPSFDEPAAPAQYPSFDEPAAPTQYPPFDESAVASPAAAPPPIAREHVSPDFVDDGEVGSPPVEDDEPEFLHIPCPNGHELETPVDMLGEEVLCPHCGAQFLLREEDSAEHQAHLDVLDSQRAHIWFNWAIAAAVIVVVGLLTMVFMALRG